MSGGLPNMGNTCYVNAAIQAIQSIVNMVYPATDTDGPILKALRRFVDVKDEAGAAAFLNLVGGALERDMHDPSDTAEFLRDFVSLLALENGTIERAFQSEWVPTSAVVRCAACGSETLAPEGSWEGLCAREYVMSVPVVPEARNLTLAEILPLLEEQHKLVLDNTEEFTCPNSSKIVVRRKMLPADVLVLNFANPFVTTVSPSFQQKLLDDTYALSSVTGFNDGHYTALVNNGHGWRLCDDRYTGDHSIGEYFTWSHATVAVFQRTVAVTLSAQFGGEPASRVQVGGTFSNWELSDAVWDNDKRSWVARVQATRGVHMYKWVVDGVWTLLSGVETTFDSAGNENQVLYV